MSALNMVGAAVPRLLGLRRSTWIGLGLTLLVLIGLSIWAFAATVSWLFGKAPEATEAGRQAAGVAIEKVEQVLPGIKEQVGVWLPGLAKGQSGAPEASGAPVPTRDVSGTDIGPVPRYAGLSREHFVDGGTQGMVRFGGRAEYAAVLAHYAEGFKTAGYQQGVQSATRTAEHHRYSSDRGQYELLVSGLPDGRVEVEVRRLSSGLEPAKVVSPERGSQ